jgi:hypothetical protein
MRQASDRCSGGAAYFLLHDQATGPKQLRFTPRALRARTSSFFARKTLLPTRSKLLRFHHRALRALRAKTSSLFVRKILLSTRSKLLRFHPPCPPCDLFSICFKEPFARSASFGRLPGLLRSGRDWHSRRKRSHRLPNAAATLRVLEHFPLE